MNEFGGKISVSRRTYSSSLDLTGAQVNEPLPHPSDLSNSGGFTPAIVLPNQYAGYVRHIALDIGGSLCKLVYFVGDSEDSDGQGSNHSGNGLNGTMCNSKGGRLSFAKFESRKIEKAIDFIREQNLYRTIKCGKDAAMRVKATGGGAYKYYDYFKENVGLIMEKVDEMECLVGGCNFLLKAVGKEAFTYYNNKMEFVEPAALQGLFPYLLVNIGSGISMIKVQGDGQYERVSGSSLGGGTFLGLGRLLTGVGDYDSLLQLAARGDNKKVDMLVGDIYGRDYSNIGLSSEVIASSFGKVVSQEGSLQDYDKADLALALCRLVSYNIGQLAYLVATQHNLHRVFFGGFYIRGHPYIMDTLSFALQFWSKGAMKAMFLRHEGFLGALGAFLQVTPITPKIAHHQHIPAKLQSKFQERFRPTPFSNTETQTLQQVTENEQLSVSNENQEKKLPKWFDKMMEVGARTIQQVQEQQNIVDQDQTGTLTPQHLLQPLCSVDIQLGDLYFLPSMEPFPLIFDINSYHPNTIDIVAQDEVKHYWLDVLEESVPQVVAKAAKSEDNCESALIRSQQFGNELKGYLASLREPCTPGSAHPLGLSELLERREDLLRDHGFEDIYRSDKDRENSASLEVLPELLKDLDGREDTRERLLLLIEGVLAANIFDWGAKACVALYNNGQILEIYKEAREKLSKRPWRVDDFDNLYSQWQQGKYRRIIIFVDNAGPDIVLGILPLVREFLRLGCEVVLAANSLPAINDITARELIRTVRLAAKICPIIAEAFEEGYKALKQNSNRVPPYPGLHRRVSSQDLSNDEDLILSVTARLYIVESGQGSPCLDMRRISRELADATVGTDLIILEGMGRSIHTNFWAKFKCDCLRLAMIKNQWIAEKLFGGDLYDCMCAYQQGGKDVVYTSQGSVYLSTQNDVSV